MMNYRLLTICIALLALTAADSASAAQERYSADDIRQGIVGRRIYLAAPMGGEFPLNYRLDGKVDGTGEALGLGRLAKPKDTGTWWVEGDQLCQKFQTWYKGQPMCFELYKTGENTLKWIRNNGQTGTARIGNSL